MPKTWEQMTTEEKVEDLRRDMKRTMETVNLWIEQQRQLRQSHDDLMKQHKETANQVSQLATALQTFLEALAKRA
jgi:hypothetical protein